MLHWIAAALSALAVVGAALLPQDAPSPTAEQIFDRRIKPIFSSPNPSSCMQCHLAGVDLKNYILPSSEKTFLSLRDQGLVNLDKPEDSKILRLIAMGENEGTKLIRDKVRKEEYESFAEWIKSCCKDPKLRDAPKLESKEVARPKRALEIIRHARKDQLLKSFEEKVWSQRFRCTGCHAAGGAQNEKLVKENGEQVNWLKPTSEATMNYLITRKLVDLKRAERSLIILKPTNQVKHGGGQKILVGDIVYKAFRSWVEDYAKTAGDQYGQAKDLPKETPGLLVMDSEVWLKIQNTPDAWAERLLQITVYAWDAEKKAWETEPIAMNDRGVSGKGKLWQHNLLLLAAPGSKRAEDWKSGKGSLRAGKYLIKVHVDQQGRFEKDWRSAWAKTDFVGQIDLDAKWPQGYGSMTVVEAGQLRK